MTELEKQSFLYLDRCYAIQRGMNDPGQDIIWSLLRYFSRAEAWGDYRMMNHTTLLLLDAVRAEFQPDQYFKVHCGYELLGHADMSFHYLAKAVDYHIVNLPFSDAITLMLSALETLGVTEQVGLGIYLDWTNKGFHLDTRGVKARWGRIIKDGSPTYVSFEAAHKLL